MIITNEYVKQVKPVKKGKSDKYSWNLYRFIKLNRNLKVYRVGWNSRDGVCPVDEGCTILRDEFGNTAILNRILTDGPKALSCCFSWSGAGWSNLDKEDITDQFFRDYLRSGVCSFASDWYHKWKSVNRNSRKCLYCGKHETRKIETIKTVKRIERWV